MPSYSYSARGADGSKHTGTVTAASEAAALDKVADWYEEEVRATLDGLSSACMALLIGLLGAGLVGILVVIVAVVMPLLARLSQLLL